MQYAHKHDPANPDDAELVNCLKAIAVALKDIQSALSDLDSSLMGYGPMIVNVHKAMLTATRAFERFASKH